MTSTVHHTTVSVDSDTALQIRQLAAMWRVSEAEVVRRAVASATTTGKPDPLAMLDQLDKANEGLSEESARNYLAEVRSLRRS